MTSREINRMPLRKQFAIVAHLYKLELFELCHLCGNAFMDAARAAACIVYELSAYHHHKHRHVRH